MSRPNIPILTSLRFFAALLVVLHHYWPARAMLPHSLTTFGYQAVTFFFILSGFVLTYTYMSEPSHKHAAALKVDVRRFYLARFARLAPLYWVALAASAYFFYRLCFVADRISTTDYTAGMISAPLFAQAWLPQLATNWNPPSWSLSVEWFFYLAFPVVAALVRRVNPWLTILICLAVNHGLVELARDLRRDLGTGDDLTYWSKVIAYFPPLLLPQFVMGMALAQIHLTWRVQRSHAFDWAVAAILVAIALYQTNPPHILQFIPFRDFLLAAFAVLVLSAANARGLVADLFSHKGLVLLGEASYALYILHFPLLQWWSHLGVQSSFEGGYELLGLGCFLALAIGASLALHLAIEIPARRYILSRAVAKTTPAQLQQRNRLHQTQAHARG